MKRLIYSAKQPSEERVYRYDGNVYQETGEHRVKIGKYSGTAVAVSYEDAQHKMLTEWWYKQRGNFYRPPGACLDMGKLRVDVPRGYCENCGRPLTDGGLCPVCDDGEPDYE